MKSLRFPIAASVLLFSPGFVPVAIGAEASVASKGTQARTGLEIVGDARFTVISPTLVRLEQSAGGVFIDESSWFAVDRAARFRDYKVSRDGDVFTLATGALTLTYRADGKAFSKDNLKIVLADGAMWTPGAPNPGNLGGTTRTLDGWRAAGSLGEGVVSKDGFYLLDDSDSYLIADDRPVARPKPAGKDLYFFGYGADYRRALQDLTRIGGKVPMPRKYMFGTWYSRYWNYTTDDYRKIVAEYHEHDFPLDVMVMDMDWHLYEQNHKGDPRFKGVNTWTGYTFDPTLIPDPAALAKWFHEQGLAVTLNDHPSAGIQRHEAAYPAYMKAMGADPETGRTIPFDAGDKDYLDTFWKYSHQPAADMGYDFWWLDWQQSKFVPGKPGLTNLAALNRYYFNATAKDGKRGASFSRWAGWGDHRHPIHFSGDAFINWEMLAFEVPMTATAGNVGCFYWSHDIGGHMGGLGRSDELYARWVQFGAMSPALRSHSTRGATLDRRPWTYAPWACDAMRRAFHLRAELMPYIYTAVRQGYDDALPLCRPMYLSGGPTDEAKQYFFGDHLICAPVTTPGVGPGKLAAQEVFLPAGDEWVNVFTHERFQGGRRVLVACDIDTFPLFVRAGAAITMRPYVERPATAKLDRLILRVYPASGDKSVVTKLYEDDGLTDAYLRGEFAVTAITTETRAGRTEIRVAPTEGRFVGQVDRTVEKQVIDIPDDATLRAVEKRLAALLGKSVALKRLEDALAYAEGDLKAPVLSALGIGLVAHNAHPYLLKGEITTRFYDTYGLVKNPPVRSGEALPGSGAVSVEIDGKHFELKR